jgi:hypothetical protein
MNTNFSALLSNLTTNDALSVEILSADALREVSLAECLYVGGGDNLVNNV